MATIALFAAVGGGAFAAAGFIDSNGKLYGCVSKKGQLTVVKAGTKCRKGQTAIAWNERGAIGPDGAIGPKGAIGPDGAIGPQGAIGPKGDKGDTGPSTGQAGGDLTGNYPNPTLKAPEAWQDLDFLPSFNCAPPSPCAYGNFGVYFYWQNRSNANGEDFNGMGYYRDREGVVHLKGLAQCANVGGPDPNCTTRRSVIFYLPAGYRPPHTTFFPTLGGTANNLHYVTIYTDGGVQSDGSADEVRPGYLLLDGMSFRCGPSGSNGCP